MAVFYINMKINWGKIDWEFWISMGLVLVVVYCCATNGSWEIP